MQVQSSPEKRRGAKDILISPTPVPCEECQALTYFSLFREWAPKPVCPDHLLPLLRLGSYPRLLERLGEVIYSHVGNQLFAPQEAYWQTLDEEQKWEQVGKFVHEQALKAAQEAVALMQQKYLTNRKE